MTTQHDDRVDPHPDKFNDPRVRVSRKGVLFAVVVILFGIGGAALSIWARKTRLEQSTAFWGPETIQAFQLAAEVELIPSASTSLADTSDAATSTDQASPADEGPDVESRAVEPEPVRLTGMPGLGHLRHVLLDDRSYAWDSVAEHPVKAPEERDGTTMMLRFSDPEAQRFPTANVLVDLEDGWVGPSGEPHRVRLNERFRKALPNFLRRVANYEPLRVDMRMDAETGGD